VKEHSKEERMQMIDELTVCVCDVCVCVCVVLCVCDACVVYVC